MQSAVRELPDGFGPAWSHHGAGRTRTVPFVSLHCSEIQQSVAMHNCYTHQLYTHHGDAFSVAGCVGGGGRPDTAAGVGSRLCVCVCGFNLDRQN